MPFAVAYFAVIYFLRKDLCLGWAFIVGGELLCGYTLPMWIAMEIAVVISVC